MGGCTAQVSVSWVSEQAWGGLGRCVMVPDVLQDVHLVHCLDLLLLPLLCDLGFC